GGGLGWSLRRTETESCRRFRSGRFRQHAPARLPIDVWRPCMLLNHRVSIFPKNVGSLFREMAKLGLLFTLVIMSPARAIANGYPTLDSVSLQNGPAFN